MGIQIKITISFQGHSVYPQLFFKLLSFIKKTLNLRVFFFVSNVHCNDLASKHIMQVPKISHSHRATNYYYYYM